MQAPQVVPTPVAVTVTPKPLLVLLLIHPRRLCRKFSLSICSKCRVWRMVTLNLDFKNSGCFIPAWLLTVRADSEIATLLQC